MHESMQLFADTRLRVFRGGDMTPFCRGRGGVVVKKRLQEAAKHPRFVSKHFMGGYV
jgi:hypothetical protein